VVDGKGTLGRHEISPYTVHFARAYTPYGPLVSDTVHPLTFFVMRVRYDAGSQRLPEKRELLERVRDRNPWQISRTITFPTTSPGDAAAGVACEAMPEMTDKRGMAVYALLMNPDCKHDAPTPSGGAGQYVVILKGSLVLDGIEYHALALV